MDINSIARIPNFDVTQFLTNGRSKAVEKLQAPESSHTPVNTPFSAPNWGKIPTKSEPKMSDEEFENAIRELARKEASQGILAGTDERSQLRRDYISVVSPDRKAMYDESMTKTGGKMNSTYSFFDALGNKSFHYNKQAGMWFHQSTDAEKARADKFLDIYTQAFSEYEAEHGEVTGTPQVKHFNAYG
jgi:hypothetical protein